MTDLTLTELKKMIENHSGHTLRSVNEARLLPYVKSRLSDYQNSLASFTLALVSDKDQSGPEWQGLIQNLTNNESFFFRDEGLFSLLEHQIIPELIEKNRSKRRLKIWSAGCSRGEELYSLAILLDQMGHQLNNWDIQLIGTDINLQVIKQARRGRYTPWSLRTLPEELKANYFQCIDGSYQLDKKLIKRCQFELFNLSLLEMGCLSGRPEEVDLILCRNVFIYFNEEAVKTALSHFQCALENGGLLITGHSELSTIRPSELVAKSYPGALVFEKRQSMKIVEKLIEPSKMAPVNPTDYKPKEPQEVVADNLGFQGAKQKRAPELCPSSQLADAEQAIQSADFDKAVLILSELSDSGAQPIDLIMQLLAKSLASLGRYPEAKVAIDQALATNDLCVECYFLAAMINELSGDVDTAILQLQNAIYLDDQYIPAYIELSAILEEEGRLERCYQLRKTAFTLLSDLPTDQKIEPYQLMAGEMKKYLKSLVAEKRSPERLNGERL